MASGKKENALDLAKFVDKSLRVKLAGGREGMLAARACTCQGRAIAPASPLPPVGAVVGTLKGYDQLLNLVLDEASEFLRGQYLLDELSRPPPRLSRCVA